MSVTEDDCLERRRKMATQCRDRPNHCVKLTDDALKISKRETLP